MSSYGVSKVLGYLLLVAIVFTLFIRSECTNTNRERWVSQRTGMYQRDLLSFSNMIHKVPSHLTIKHSNVAVDGWKSKKSQAKNNHKQSKFQGVQQHKPKDNPTRGRAFPKPVYGRYRSRGPCIVGQKKDKLGVCREIW